MLDSLKGDPAFSTTMQDISVVATTAEKLHMYSPTLLVFNGKLRWNGPISLDIIRQIARGDTPEPKPYKVKLGENLFSGTVEHLTEDTVPDTCLPCVNTSQKSVCTEKASWVKQIRDSFHLPHLGILHYSGDQCVGGAEFVPSRAVPYPVPRGDKIAFLTCSFLSDEVADYRTAPLRKLEEELPGLGFSELIAVVSEEVVFPNGTLKWFLGRGYRDLGEVYFEERDFARQHLVKKEL